MLKKFNDVGVLRSSTRHSLLKLTAKDTKPNQTSNTILIYIGSPRNSLLASLYLIVKIASLIIEIVQMCFF
ncbi:hypothetical protein EC844_12423 [Acinetobacter calcoaceticus]|uniref:Uncharacterized protein n=1 Tax=Acinetobacter calcoaceticus TaxID=471 RepID=A0A4R1XLQ0_ACICA|nr:hypothetical protein EC844_12423 [Acinetobacter calcoaceticus]